ncbi:MAG: glycoside hydrolase family 16 protein [Clostridiales bacterium]|nr:glycoside hydrolase family 16 protein [Clostridiales bacterium]
MRSLSSFFAKRQLVAFSEIFIVLGKIFKDPGDLKKVIALFTVLGQLMCAFVFDTPVTPYKDKIDMDKFELVWSDEFDHGFDTKIWQGHYVYGADDTQIRDTAYWNRGQVSFTDDGCLKLTVDYKENGPAGPGYYSYGMETNPNKNYSGDHTGYEQLYGYFEMRCILPKGTGINPAFWLLTDGMWADDTDGGVSGAEVDIFETNTKYDVNNKEFGSVYHTIHIDSYEEAHRAENQGSYYADDPYNKFNTYGVEWNSEEYIFYINGIETARTSFGGVCQVPLYLIISVGVDDNIMTNQYIPSSMIVDYVRCYQYKN